MAKAEYLTRIENVLPTSYKPHAQRYVQRALLTFVGNSSLQSCPPMDFLRLVVEAAELGLAIDNRLCYVVKYKSQYALQPSYLGMVAVARRAGLVLDAEADLVCEQDIYTVRKIGARTEFIHEHAKMGTRGAVIGAYARLVFPDGRFRIEEMSRDELDKVKAAAPSKNGPWQDWEGQMQKKSVLKRALKPFQDHPDMVALMSHLEREDEPDDSPRPTLPVGRVNLRRPPAEFDLQPPQGEQEDLQKSDSVNDVGERIQNAESEAELQAIAADIEPMSEWLGENIVGQLNRQLAARRKQIGKEAERG